MQIVYLSDYDRLIPELARLHFQEWSYLRPGESLEGRTERLRRSCGKGLPSVMVGLDDDQLCGSAMLVPNDLDACPSLTPWLAGVYVKPALRNRGIGNQLIAHVVRHARALGFHDLYLYTPGNEQLYARLGWTVLKCAVHEGTSVTIMSKPLSQGMHVFKGCFRPRADTRR